MISSSEPAVKRGLDAMLIVYSLLDSHPASTVCEQFISDRTGWFTTAVTLFEVKAILTKVYGVDPVLISQKLMQFIGGPIVVVAVDVAIAQVAMNMADTLNIDLTDAVLLYAAQVQGARSLATDDGKLAQACRQVGIIPEHPIDASLRQQMVEWETAHLPAKGLPRVLHQIHRWLSQIHPQTAQDFWSKTGGGTHPP